VHSSIVTLVNSAIGAGILALPYAFRCTGWAAGLATVFSLGATQAYTLFVLSRHAEYAGSTTYGALVRLIDRLRLSTMMCAAAAASCCFMAVRPSSAAHTPLQVRKMLGKRASLALCAVIVVFLFLACSAFLMLIGEQRSAFSISLWECHQCRRAR
jgi:amino acid permease